MNVVGIVIAVVCLSVAAVFGVWPMLRLLRIYVRTAVGVLGPTNDPVRSRPPDAPDGPPHHAYRAYLFGPAMRDVVFIWRRTVDEATHDVEEQFADLAVVWRTLRYEWVSRLWATAWGAGVVVGTTVGAAVVLVVTAVHIALVYAGRGAQWAAVGILRFGDSLWLRVNDRRRMICPSRECGHAISYPSYACPWCTRIHRDVRPGPHGVLRRRCACDTRQGRLPTLLTLGSHRLSAHCPDCEQPLPDGTGTVPALVLPLLGGTGAGKTRLMAAMMAALERHAERLGTVMEETDGSTAQDFAALRQAIDTGRPTDATHVELRRAYSFRVLMGRRGRMAHLFDVAGEHFGTVDGVDELRHLSEAGSFLFVLDPLAIRAFSDDLTADERARIPAELRSGFDPEPVLSRAIDRAIAAGVVLGSCRLGVAISKTDVLGATGPLRDVPRDSASARAWLTERLGLTNLVRLMEQDFREVTYFFTAAVARQGSVDDSITEVVAWMLRDGRSPLPATRPTPTDAQTEGAAPSHPGIPHPGVPVSSAASEEESADA